MADTSGMAEIRGIDIDKLAKGFADEKLILKQYVVNSTTKAREIRWYQKTAGFLDTTDTSGISGSQVQTDELAIPQAVERSWTRTTSYPKTFMLESPTISSQDIKDSDPDIIATNVRDIVRGVQRQVEIRIFEVLFNALPGDDPLTISPNTVQTTAATAGWDQTATANPILDILNGKQLMRAQGYDPEGSMLGMNSIENKHLLVYLIDVKGSSIPQFSSEKVKSGVVMELLGCNLVVSEAFTTDWVYQWIPSRAATWKAFTPISSVVIDEPLIGKKIRVKEEGECILTDPNAVHVISNTIGV